MDEWTSLKNILPPYDEWILLVRLTNYGESSKPQVVYGKRTHTDSAGEHFTCFLEEEIFGDIIYWMPLPEIPTIYKIKT